MISGPGFSIGYTPLTRESPQRQKAYTPADREPAEQTRKQSQVIDVTPISVERGNEASGDAQAAYRQRVNAAAESDAVRFRRQQEVDELPLRNQQALQTYARFQSNGAPDGAGSQLMGVDIFV